MQTNSINHDYLRGALRKDPSHLRWCYLKLDLVIDIAEAGDRNDNALSLFTSKLSLWLVIRACKVVENRQIVGRLQMRIKETMQQDLADVNSSVREMVLRRLSSKARMSTGNPPSFDIKLIFYTVMILVEAVGISHIRDVIMIFKSPNCGGGYTINKSDL